MKSERVSAYQADTIVAERVTLHETASPPDSEPLNRTLFTAQFGQLLGKARVTRMSLPPGHTVHNTGAMHGDDTFTLLVSRNSRIEVGHRDRSFIVGPGGGTIMRSSEPGLLGSKQSFSFVSFAFPVECSLGRQTAIDSQAGRPIERSNRVLMLIKGYIRQMESCAGAEDPVQDTVYRHLIELTGLLAESNSRRAGSRSDAVNIARLARVRERISRQACDPSFSLRSAASAERVSTRYLQRIIEQSGDTFTEMVKRKRLETAWALLTDPTKQHLRIIEITTMSGFSDLSHFNRLFRRRYGQTPRDARVRSA